MRRPSFFRMSEPLLGLRRARLFAVLWALFLFTLTSWPSPPEVPVVSSIPNFDKVVHATLYGVEGFLLYFAIRWRGGVSWRRALVIGAILAIWGTLDEIHQLWIPGRSCEVGDAVTDTVAGLAGGLAAFLWSSRRAAPEPTSSPRS